MNALEIAQAKKKADQDEIARLEARNRSHWEFLEEEKKRLTKILVETLNEFNGTNGMIFTSSRDNSFILKNKANLVLVDAKVDLYKGKFKGSDESAEVDTEDYYIEWNVYPNMHINQRYSYSDRYTTESFAQKFGETMSRLV